MLIEKRERWFELCKLATVEQDPSKMVELLREINRVLKEEAAFNRLLRVQQQEHQQLIDRWDSRVRERSASQESN